MRHLFIRGGYKPLGASGEAIIDAMLSLKPEIYGDIDDPSRVEIGGLLYIFPRLPQGIEECRYIHLIGKEGYQDSDFETIVPAKRRRNCYRIDHDRMYIEMTRGRSDIYDLLTHLTFLYIEAEKIKNNALDYKNRRGNIWYRLEEIIAQMDAGEEVDLEVATSYLSTLLGLTFEEAKAAVVKFDSTAEVNSLFKIAYWLGRRSLEEHLEDKDREVSFSNALRQKVGHHIYGETWASKVKAELKSRNLLGRPLHIISSNMHSVLNSLYAPQALAEDRPLDQIALQISQDSSLQAKVHTYALAQGMTQIADDSGMNISVQIIDTKDIEPAPPHIPFGRKPKEDDCPVLIVMDYAFGEQAFETMDELLKPYEEKGKRSPLDVRSINIMGKAGILEGKKGDIMIPTSFVFEGSADNYRVLNSFQKEDFEGQGLEVFEGSMITVLGTSLQNKDVLRYFLRSSWQSIGLEMEGAHYHKAIQAESQIRHSISSDVVLRYAYYASDNPLETGNTLASGSLGAEGVKPTYLITMKILEGIMQ